MPQDARPDSGTKRFPVSWQIVVTILHDALATAASWILAYLLRFNFDVSAYYTGRMFADLIWILPVQALVAFWSQRGWACSRSG